MTLPIREAPEPAAAPRPHAPETEREERRSLRILLVEDRGDIARIIRRIPAMRGGASARTIAPLDRAARSREIAGVR